MADISYLRNEDLGLTDETSADKDDRETDAGEENADFARGGETGDGGGGGGGGGDEGDVYDVCNVEGSEQLPSLAKLQLYATSQSIINRLLVGRVLCEIFRNAVDTRAQIPLSAILASVEQVAADPEASVRSELMEQLPHVAMICQEAPERFGHVLPQHLLGIFIKYLQDDDNQVRKTTQAALLVLMERGLIGIDSIEQFICPVVLDLSYINDPSVEIHTGAIALMCKMAPLVGRELTERMFLNRFVKLCSDETFYVRKVCAANLADFCAAVSEESIENILLPKFTDLCLDDVWGVRKACAEAIISVACCVSLFHRQATLAPAFSGLLGDTSRWVRMSAFQTLGPFISTFADQFTGLEYNQYGEIVFTNRQGTELRYNKLSYSNPWISNLTDSYITGQQKLEEDLGLDDMHCQKVDEKQPNILVRIRRRRYKQLESIGNAIRLENATKSNNETETSDADDFNKFNPFLYYYISPEMPLDLDLVEAGRPSTATEETPKEQDQTSSSKQEETTSSLKQEDATLSPKQEETTLSPKQEGGTSSPKQEEATSSPKQEEPTSSPKPEEPTSSPKPEEPTSSLKQEPETNSQEIGDTSTESNETSVGVDNSSELLDDTADVGDVSVEIKTPQPPNKVTPVDDGDCIVPHYLIDYFVLMAEPVQATAFDCEVPQHCAFSFPAVVLTLGKSKWPLLKDAYLSLASAVPWKVRRTLASSIHEVAIILGEELTARDLVPIYDEFIKDLDEVRIGALKHLATFLKVLRPAERRKYLPRLNNFMITDNEWNWRFREELGNQLLEAVTLYNPHEVAKYIIPLSIHLLGDKIAAVRIVALDLVTEIVSHLSVNEARVATFVRQLRDVLPRSVIWSCRQTYANLCSRLIANSAISAERFSKEMLPRLLELSQDPVPNVRIAVARTIALHVDPRGVDWQGGSEQAHLVDTALTLLMNDMDKDVRASACLIRRRRYTSVELFIESA